MPLLWCSPRSTTTLVLITISAFFAEGLLTCLKDLELTTDPDSKLKYPFPSTSLPMCPEYISTVFMLYTKDNRKGVPITVKDDKLNINTNLFETENGVKIIIHGWLQSADKEPLENIKESLMDKLDVNVITVDWKNGSRARIGYDKGVKNTWVVGLQVAQLVNLLTHGRKEEAARVHIIGFSLGAHAAGFAGERIPGLGRITGLDPGRPEFEGMSENQRLDPSDAAFVDVIHTDTTEKHYPYSGYGYSEPCGDVDFYPNWDTGTTQPGCHYLFLEIPGCAHLRVLDYFLESIKSLPNCSFHAELRNPHDVLGKSGGDKIFANMGIDANKIPERIKQLEWPRKFYLKINSNSTKYSVNDTCAWE